MVYDGRVSAVVIYRDLLGSYSHLSQGARMDLGFTVRILKEGEVFVAHVPELDVSTCADTEAEARRNITDAVRGFLETAQAQDTLHAILQEAGYLFEDGRWKEPVLIGVEHMSVGLR